jgi:hypothetical protein
VPELTKRRPLDSAFASPLRIAQYGESLADVLLPCFRFVTERIDVCALTRDGRQNLGLFFNQRSEDGFVIASDVLELVKNILGKSNSSLPDIVDRPKWARFFPTRID